AFTFAMDSMPGSPQIQNIIPTTFFGTTTTAAPILGPIGGVFILVVGIVYLNWRRRQAIEAGEGYGTGHLNEPDASAPHSTVPALLAFTPLVLVAGSNWLFTQWIPTWYGATTNLALTPGARPVVLEVSRQVGIWAVTAALLLGIGAVVVSSYK